MMFFDGYIAAPPTILVISAKAGITYEGAARPIPAASAAAQYKILAFMFVSVDRFNRSLSRPPSIGVRVLRSGPPEVSRLRPKKRPTKIMFSARNAGPNGNVLKIEALARVLETWH